MRSWFFLSSIGFSCILCDTKLFLKKPKKSTSSIHLLNLLAGVIASKKPDSEKFFSPKRPGENSGKCFQQFFQKSFKIKNPKKLVV